MIAAILTICGTVTFASCTANDDNPSGQKAESLYVPMAPDYSASEYPPFRGFLNVGDIHSCEPWLYSECLQRNIKVRAKEWRKIHQPTVTRIWECQPL